MSLHPPRRKPPKPPKATKKLTRKQGKLVRAVVAEPEATLKELALKSTYQHEQTVHGELQKPHVQAGIVELMNQSPKLQMPSLLKKLEDGLDAVDAYPVTTGRGEDKVFELKEVPNFSVRHKYLETALELQGAMNKDNSSVAGPLNIAIIMAGGGT